MSHHLEHFRGEVRGRAVALRGDGDLARIGARVGDEFGNGVRLDLGIDDQRVRHPAHDRDRDELHRVEAELGIEIVIDDERRRRRREQRVAVGIGFGGDLRADVAGGAGPVLDDDGLSPFARQPVADHARHDVGGAAGRERHDDLDRAGGIILRGNRRRRQCRQREREAQEPSSPRPRPHRRTSTHHHVSSRLFAVPGAR